MQYEIISEFDGEESAHEFINSHLENDKFRETAIEYAINKKDYHKALGLCSEAEKQGGNYRGQTDKWKKLRYKIYEETGNTDDQKKLAHEFTLDGEFEYYLKLRNLYAGNSEDTGEWHQVFDDILSAVIKPYPKSIYTEILIHENMKPELLEYCKNSEQTIVNYYQHLLPDYKDEVNEIFKEYLMRTASQASDRGKYKEVCGLIKKYAKVCGNQNAIEIVREFKSQYVKRPAFIDELGKIKI